MIEKMTCGTASWTCEDNQHVGKLWYIKLDEAHKPPYRTQVHVSAILDIAEDGTLAGIELIEAMPPAPLKDKGL